MAEEQTTTPAVTQGNSTEARTETGEIKDQQVASKETTEAKSTDIPAKSEAKADDKTLLNKDAKDTKAPEKPVVPEKYEFKAPEGYEVDQKFIEKATPVLKELGLSNEQGQKLVDLYNEKLQEQAQAPYDLYLETRKGWQEKVFNDPSLGNGSELKPEVRARISHAIDMLPNAKEYREVMDMTGAGDNPAFVKAWDWIAKQIGEGTGVRGGGPSKLGQTAPGAAPKSAASAMYPNLPTSSG